MPSVLQKEGLCVRIWVQQQDCVQNSGPKWQGQLSDGTEGHRRAMLGSFGQVLLSSARVWLLLVFLIGLVRDIKT